MASTAGTLSVKVNVDASVAGVVLKPGDNVLLTHEDRFDDPDALIDALKTHFPDVNFALIEGISGLAVQPADPDA